MAALIRDYQKEVTVKQRMSGEDRHCGSPMSLRDSPYRLYRRSVTSVRVKNIGSELYLQFSPIVGTLHEVNTDSLGEIYKEDFKLRTNSAIIYCCRIFVQTNNQIWYLSYDPSGEGERIVEFQAYERERGITHIDGRCFVVRRDGDHTFLRAFCRKDLYVCWDNERENYVLEPLRDLDTAVPKFRFYLWTPSYTLRILYRVFSCLKPSNRVKPKQEIALENRTV